MQHRSNQGEASVGRPVGKPAAATSLPTEWTRLFAAAGGDADTSTGNASTLGFLLELLQQEPPVSRIEVAPVLLEIVATGRLGRAVPLDSRQLLNAGLSGPKRASRPACWACRKPSARVVPTR